jgi:hypothetical protein
MQTHKPPSVVDRRLIARMIRIARLTPVDGSIAEVGVYRGGTAYYLSALARLRAVKLFLYDTFTGIPHSDTIDHHKVGDFSDTNELAVRHAVPYACYRVGVFPLTFTEFHQQFSFVHVDCDQYQSVTDCILMFTPLMLRGGVMWFDDYGVLAGATRAVHMQFHEARLNYVYGRAFVRF